MKKKLIKNKNNLLTVNIKPDEKILRKLYKNDYYQKNLSLTIETCLTKLIGIITFPKLLF